MLCLDTPKNREDQGMVTIVINAKFAGASGIKIAATTFLTAAMDRDGLN